MSTAENPTALLVQDPITYRHEYECLREGPYTNVSASPGGCLLLANGNTPTRMHFDRKWVMESARVLMETLPAGAATITVQLFWAAPGQSMTAAVSAGQALTNALSLAGRAVGTWYNFTVDPKYNVIAAGERIFIKQVSDADGAGGGTTPDVTMDGFHLEVRRRTLVH